MCLPMGRPSPSAHDGSEPPRLSRMMIGLRKWVAPAVGSGVCPLSNRIGNYCRILIARIIWGERLNVSPLGHPWLELARVSHHGLDIVTPSAALLAIEDYIGNRNLLDPRLIGSLEGNGPNQVV